MGTIRRHRTVYAALAAFLCALTLVWGTTAQPAHALVDETLIQYVPPVAAGTATVTGGVVTACATVVGCPAVAVTVGTAVVAYGGYRVVKWAFASPEIEAEPLPGSPTTSYGGGCWSYWRDPPSLGTNGSAYDDSTNCNNTIGVGPNAQKTLDGFDMYFYSMSSPFMSLLPVLLHSVEGGSTSGSVQFELSWSRAGTFPSQTHAFAVVLRCQDGTEGGSWWPRQDPDFNAGSGGQTNQGAIAASTCAGKGGVRELWFAGDNSFTGPDTGYGFGGSTAMGDLLARYQFDNTPTNTATPAPDHKWRTVKTCGIPGSGTPTTTLTEYSSTFKEADANLPDMPNPICPTGTLPKTMTVYEGDAQGEGGPARLEWEAPPEWDTETSLQYSDCLPGGSAYPCSVRLLKPSPNGLLECTRSDVDCSSFDPETSTETQYQCRWGTYTMELSECAQLEPDTATTPGTDPGTGTESDIINGNDRPDLLTNPTASNKNCMGGGWGWNPVEWVLKPVKCALAWAFVPSGSPIADLQAAYEGSVIESLLTPVEVISGSVSALSGALDDGNPDCHGPSADVPLGAGSSTFTFEPLNTCSGPAATAAAAVRTILTAVFLIGGGVAIANLVLGAFGLKVLPKREGATSLDH